MSRWPSALFLVILFFAANRILAQEDVADVPSERIKLAKKQIYFLIGADAKAQELRPLLLVLPGGDGSEEFNPFIKRIWKNAAPDYVVAQLVAVGTDDPKNIIWPTATVRHVKQNFTTESFIADVVKDVSKRVKIDPQRVYALGWSSGGPPLYAAAATESSPVKGHFVAMSVFRANMIGRPAVAKTRRFYIYHSREDRVCPFKMAEEAKTQLEKMGAEVKFVEYAGGHGWQGDMFGDIRKGVDWLGKKAE
jgi:predicted esterase